MTGPLSSVDRPVSYIGKSVPRPNAKRLLAGRGRYVDDIRLPRLAHAAFLRCPYAHARLVSLDIAGAARAPGVVRVVTAKDLAGRYEPWVGTLTHFKGMKSAPQHPLVRERATWQGEPVVAVVAESRALAEDAVALIDIVWEELPPLTDMQAVLEPGAAPLHAELGDNLCFARTIDAGTVDAAFAAADCVVEEAYSFARHTGVCLEPRSILADFDPAAGSLTVHYSSQAPHMMKEIFARHFRLPESAVRVICNDVGGSYGVKIHVYPDEMTTVAIAVMLGRPVKFIADRLESFVSDIHAREHRIKARMALAKDGTIAALTIDDVTGIGPYSTYPRTSVVEGNQVIGLAGSWYRCRNYRAQLRVAFQTKPPTTQYRAVGHPIATAVTEALVDRAAGALGLDPVELRRRNLIPDDAYPWTTASGLKFEKLSQQASLAKLLTLIDYDGLRREQAALRPRGVYRGIGIACFVELTNPGPAFYGVGGAPISSQDGCTIRLDPGGSVTCATGVTEQGQGTETMVAQIVASTLSVALDHVRVVTGDTERTPYGGGTWASRGCGIGGEAALQGALALKANILALAGAMLQADPAALDLAGGWVVDRDGGNRRIGLDEVGRAAYFRGDTLPPGVQPELVATRHYMPREYPFAFTNGVQASYLELDVETGFVKLLKHWVVEDCGRVVNPLLVEEQIRGGVVQGIGGALFEECIYDDRGQLLNGTLADYLVPMAGEMPDIEVAHVETPTAESALGAKGAGEAGTGGAPGAILNAVNDALTPFKVRVTAQPISPRRVLEALGKA
ncbi:MAG TPA: xanthine dehydrogenase family protein molybdopterin-binding subunit [Stellaceae bacterium]|nr:xanthine dehydrogenase family protein molybdopterin-binding subunit [Stellaceae bacterium]